MTSQKQTVALATEKSIASRSTPADIDDIDLSGIEIPYRAAFSVAIPRLYTSGRPPAPERRRYDVS